MSTRLFSSLGRLARRGISRAQAAAAAATKSSVEVLFPAALGSGAVKYPRALALTGSLGGGSQGCSDPGVPVFAMITLATLSACCYLKQGEASAKGKPANDAEEASTKGKPKGTDGGLPASVNWVEKGAVTTPRNQGKCGSCWVHSSVSAVESGYQIKTGKLMALSTQQLIDCALRDFGSTEEVVLGKGCEGGNFNQAFRHIKAYGLMSAKSYPHRWFHLQGECCYKAKKVEVTIRDFDYCKPSEIELMGAVAIRPVVVFMDAFTEKVRAYRGGIIEIEDWPPASEEKHFYRHAVLVVGYGTAANGKDYWLIKNSWGTIWGEKGYGRIRRGTGNPLGVGGIHRTYGCFPVM